LKAKYLALGALVVAGCASVPEYKPAPGAPRARLTLERGEIQAAAISFWTDGSTCSAPQILPPAFWDGKSVEIEAGKELAVGMATVLESSLGPVTVSSTTCGMQVISFTPSANSDYKLKYVADRTAKTCQMTLVRADGGREALDPTARRRAPTNASSKDKPGCN
jgi:hypothetical protein